METAGTTPAHEAGQPTHTQEETMNFNKYGVAAALALLALGGAQAGQRAQLDVQLSFDNAIVQGDSDVPVNVVITNNTGTVVPVLKWQLPTGKLQGKLFRVVGDDGQPATYVGPMIKRAEPREQDYILLQPGASLSYQVELTSQYVLGNGHYTVEYVGGGVFRQGVDFRSTATNLWTQGRSAPAESLVGDASLRGRTGTQGISYTGGCSSSRQSTLASAVSAATTYSSNAYSYLSGSGSGTQRYVKWFGSYTSSRWATAKSHYSAIKSAFTTQNVTLDCSCTDSGTYAYVYPTQPYKIYVCGAFWNAPMTGTDSKGGTLVHEMSHFNVVASTDDWAYGQTAAANLAKSNPTKALDNADNHEYFAENNPALP